MYSRVATLVFGEDLNPAPSANLNSRPNVRKNAVNPVEELMLVCCIGLVTQTIECLPHLCGMKLHPVGVVDSFQQLAPLSTEFPPK